LGLAGSAFHETHLGHGGQEGHLGHSGPGWHAHDAGHAGHLGHVDPGFQGTAGGQGGPVTPGHPSPSPGHASGTHPAGHPAAHHGLPLLNVSSALAFVTWFGAAGYVLTAFAGWTTWLAVPAAVAAGIAGSLIIAFFLAKVIAGEREMDPRDYRLEGTVARVTVRIPARGTGEIVFTKGGVRRSEAARNLSGHLVPRDTEVVILEYERGIATVQPWDELVGRSATQSAEAGAPPAGRDERESHA
ncbi:MAG TPA: hypothetical protein VHL09_10520, partial [Dehalococcoidia bacterium]|nr:hypothetical protein [Dehalococcoidia bacterium]